MYLFTDLFDLRTHCIFVRSHCERLVRPRIAPDGHVASPERGSLCTSFILGDRFVLSAVHPLAALLCFSSPRFSQSVSQSRSRFVYFREVRTALSLRRTHCELETTFIQRIEARNLPRCARNGDIALSTRSSWLRRCDSIDL